MLKNPKVLYFSSLTEALQPKLLIYLIGIFVHNMTLNPQEAKQSTFKASIGLHVPALCTMC